MSMVPQTRPLFRELGTIRERFENLFAQVSDSDRLTMPLDVQETDDSVIIRATVPGIRSEDLKIDISNGMLTIQGETREESEEEKGTWYMRERRFGRIYRSISLPAPIKEDAVEARLVNGVLEIKLAKTDIHPPHRIEVKTG